MKNTMILSIFTFMLPFWLFSDPIEPFENSWTGHSFRATLGSTFDFQLELKKGTGFPTEAMLRYGYEYGYQFDFGLYLSAELDWMIVYPRNFNANGQPLDFFQPPISLWYVPLSNVQLGYAFNPQWLLTTGLVYYWGLSNSLRYRFTEHGFLELSSVVWMDRIFNTGGFYGGGLDNLLLSFGIGYKI